PHSTFAPHGGNQSSKCQRCQSPALLACNISSPNREGSRLMSRKSLRNASKPASQRTLKVGLSSLALGSVTFGLTGLLHAQNAQPLQPASGTPKPRAKADQASGKSTRWRTVRVASNDTLPPEGAGLVAQAAAPQGAAEPGPTTPAASSADQLQEIVVTGIRGSLERSLQIKKLSLGVVDAVSAEDIGQFPDSSIGQSIGRITGVTVRGFADQFNELLVEGRPVASGNGQTFDFSTMSANYVGEIDIHKTPDFSISSGAVGATINVKFPDPFDNPGLHAQGFVSETDYELDGGMRPAFGGLLSDTFADGKFGILIDGDYTDHHIVGHHQDRSEEH